MHLDLERHSQAFGFMTRPHLRDCGWDDRAIAAAVRAKVITRIGPGLYADHALYASMTPEQRHVLRCRAVKTRLGDVVFSHQSAACIHEIATWGIDLDTVQVTRRDTGRGRRQAGVCHHLGELRDHEVSEVDGLLVVTPARAVWEVAMSSTIESGVVTADSALHRQLIVEDDLVEQGRIHAAWTGSRRARLTLTFADGRSESPGESRGRWFFQEQGLPAPELQHLVLDRNGQTIARTD